VKMPRFARSLRWPLRVGAVAGVLLAASGAYAIITGSALVKTLHPTTVAHVVQGALYLTNKAGDHELSYTVSFREGDELFEATFTSVDGVGANVGKGERFTHVPRADLTGPTEWANHKPPRATGPNAQSCASCHLLPTQDGAGSAANNVHRDPTHSGVLSKFIQRNTTALFGLGALQRLAEEMTVDLFAQRKAAYNQSCAQGGITIATNLVSKGVSFGSTGVKCTGYYTANAILGVNADLIVRPFQWKGSIASIRTFNREAAHDELGMQAQELLPTFQDGDGDGVVNELSVGDITALTIYLAAQPRPTSKTELSALGLIPALTTAQADEIALGGTTFDQIGCNGCHVRQLTLDDPIFSEPSLNPNYRDAMFPGGQNPTTYGLDPAWPTKFDLTQDQPDNVLLDANGDVTFRLGSFATNVQGQAVIELLSDLKRHNMGYGLAEAIDEVGTGHSVFMTRPLWGVGSTAPYLHDGRATTLTEAILEHGGEAQTAGAAFVALPVASQKAVIAFLDNLVLFKTPLVP
jgi:hypothetical protein